jgi:hypothetical protein
LEGKLRLGWITSVAGVRNSRPSGASWTPASRPPVNGTPLNVAGVILICSSLDSALAGILSV